MILLDLLLYVLRIGGEEDKEREANSILIVLQLERMGRCRSSYFPMYADSAYSQKDTPKFTVQAAGKVSSQLHL